jgi:hypothetical protein
LFFLSVLVYFLIFLFQGHIPQKPAQAHSHGGGYSLVVGEVVAEGDLVAEEVVLADSVGGVQEEEDRLVGGN